MQDFAGFTGTTAHIPGHTGRGIRGICSMCYMQKDLSALQQQQFNFCRQVNSNAERTAAEEKAKNWKRIWVSKEHCEFRRTRI